MNKIPITSIRFMPKKLPNWVHGLVKPESGSFMEVRIQDLWRLLPALQKKMEL